MEENKIVPRAYEETAYDSSRPRELPPPMVDSERSFMSRSWLKYKLDSLPVECAEFLSLSGHNELESLRSGKMEEQVKEYPLQLYWLSVYSSAYLVAVFRFAGAAVALATIVTMFIASLVLLPDVDAIIKSVKIYAVVIVVSALIYLLFDFLMKLQKDIEPGDHGFAFDRITGMVHLPPNGGERKAIPFDEFSPYLQKVTSPHGFTTYGLILGHQYSNLHLLHQESLQSVEKVYLEWEFYRQFMDISKPLPDVPELELHRQYDPTTVEWDKKYGRPPDLWRTYDSESYYALVMASGEAADRFPWGGNRLQAVYSGWLPSCYSRMTWFGGPQTESGEDNATRWQRCVDPLLKKKERLDAARKLIFKLLFSLISAVYEGRKSLLKQAKDALENYTLTAEHMDYFVSIVESAEQNLKQIEGAMETLKRAEPTGVVDGDISRPPYLHKHWLDTLETEITSGRILAAYIYPDNDAQKRLQSAKVTLQGILAAIDTLKPWESYPGEIVPQKVKETLGAFLAGLSAQGRQLAQQEVDWLNSLLEQELTSEQYLGWDSEKPEDNLPTQDMVSLLVYLSKINMNLVVFVVNRLDVLINEMIMADGNFDESEWQGHADYRALLGKALGVEIAPPDKPDEATS